MTSQVEDPRDLIGRAESLTLEFKAAEALKKPSRIAREVVAMLNADGGAIWIGVPEIDGRAGAPETIDNLDQARESLRNHLLDTIEPSPGDAEVRCETRAGVIRVSVRGKESGRPYALRKDQGRQFWIRVDSVVREMTRDQIATAFGAKAKGDRDEIGDAKRRLDDDWLKEYRSGRERFWWKLISVPRLTIDARLPERKEFLQTLLTDPKQSGNRRNGWSVVYLHDRLPKVRSDGGITHTFGDGKDEQVVAIDADGAMTFALPRINLYRGLDETGTEMFPFALLEFPVSAFRVAARVLDYFGGTSNHDRQVICTALICGIGDARLRPGSPNSPVRPWKHVGSPREDKILVNHLVIQASEIISNPDAAAYPLLWKIYEEFQLDEEDIPAEFDRKDKVLRLP